MNNDLILKVPAIATTIFNSQIWSNQNIKLALEIGDKKLPQYSSVMREVFGGLLYLPGLSEKVEKVTDDLKWGESVIDSVTGDAGYTKLIEKTAGSSYHSGVALHRIAEYLAGQLPADNAIENPEEIRDQVREINDKIKQLKEDALAVLAAGIACNGAGLDSDDEQKAIAQLQSKKSELIAKGKAAVEACSEKTAKIAPKLGRSAARAVEEAQDAVDKAEDIAEAFGWGDGGDDSTGGEKKIDPQSMLEIYLKIKNNKNLLEIIRQAGRFHKIASLIKQKSIQSGETSIVGCEHGRDIRKVTSRELMLLASDRTKPLFMDRFAKSNLQQHRYSQKTKAEKGDVFLFRDCSGSTVMKRGINEYIAAITWAIALAANKQSRSVEIANFHHQVFETYSFKPNKIKESELLSVVGKIPNQNDGTDWMAALDFGVGFIERSQGKLAHKVAKMTSKFDFILITDGECDVKSEWLDKFIQFKKEYGVTVYSALVMPASYASNETMSNSIIEKLGKFSDKVINILDMDSDRAASELIASAL